MVEASLAAASASPAWLLSRISRTFTKVVRLNVDIAFRSVTAVPPRGIGDGSFVSLTIR